MAPAFFRLEIQAEPASLPVLSTARELRQGDGHPFIGVSCDWQQGFPDEGPGLGPMSRKWFNRTAQGK